MASNFYSPIQLPLPVSQQTLSPAPSMASSLSSILNQPQCALLRFRIQKRCCFSLRLLSSYPETSLDPRCARRSTTRQLKRSFSLNLSRNFSHSSLDLPDGPGLHHFIAQSSFTASQPLADLAPASEVSSATGSEVHSQGRIYQETYGCQMNVNDMEIVLSIMKNAGYSEVINVPENAEVIFINTCAIRDYAEHKVWQRLNYFWFLKREWKKNVATGRSQSKHPPKIVVLGCMAERLKDKILDADKMVDVVCGPDAYRDLPRLLEEVDYGQKGINTLLSLEETYADISPVRISKNSVTAFVSVMRGCNNMCSFCIVPFTRGRERSRPLESIVKEVAELWKEGVKEVTLLGQNVNSYNDTSGMEKEVEPGANWRLSEGFNSMCKVKKMGLRFADLLPLVKEVEPGANWRLSEGFKNMCKVKKMGLRFADLLDRLSLEFPEMRFRYTSPHPKDFPDELLYIMRDRPNVCKYIHLPAQTGNSAVLERMRRGYTREAYLDLVQKIRQIIPDVGLSSDFICGFCGETEEEHADTLTLMKAVGYDMAYMFAYSMRERTHAHRNYVDDVPEEVKQRRLTELIEAF